MKLLLKNLLLFLILCSYSGIAQNTKISGMSKLQWKKEMPGVWSASFGRQGLNPLDYSGTPKYEAIQNLGDSSFPFNNDSTFYSLTSNRAAIRLPLKKDEKIYGLGLEFNGANRRGNVYTLKVDHYGGINGYTHAPVPFYISSDGYGVLINSAKRVKIYVGVGNRKDSNKPQPIDRTTGNNWSDRPLSDAVEASVYDEGLQIIVFGGNNLLEVIQRYNLFCGGGVLPPKWGLGFWHRMHTKSTAVDVLKEVQDFKKNNFPLQVIGLEPGWQNFAYPCSFDWDSKRFPDPAGFVDELKKQGIRVNLWENPYVAPVSTMYDSIKSYTASHTVWLGEVPDYSIPQARKVLLDHHQKNHIDIGVSGYKFDEVDGYDFWLWPDHATFPSGNDAVEMRQLYGLIMQQMFTKHYKDQNKRTYGLVRSSYIGASDKNFVIYSDYYGHKGYVTALTNASLAGLLWVPEIRDAKTSEEWVRRFQTVCFSPLMMLNAWFSGKKPWSFPEVTDVIRDVINLRMQLMPYIYTSFYEYEGKGIPPFRAMLLEEGYNMKESIVDGKLDDQINPYAQKKLIEVTDQYMMGPSILVAPVFTGQTSRNVVLPKGNWFDFYTGEFVGNGQTINVNAEIEKIPLFVKDGAIIPMEIDGEKGNHRKLSVRVYGKRENSYTMYNDDGETYNYENGEYTLTKLMVTKNRKGDYKGKIDISNKKFIYHDIEWVWMSK